MNRYSVECRIFLLLKHPVANNSCHKRRIISVSDLPVACLISFAKTLYEQKPHFWQFLALKYKVKNDVVSEIGTAVCISLRSRFNIPFSSSFYVSF